MIEAGGLCIVSVHNCKVRRTQYPRTYHLGIARRAECCAAAGPSQHADRVTSLGGRHVSRSASNSQDPHRRCGVISTMLIGSPEEG